MSSSTRLLALAAGAAFLALLDVTIVNLAIPALGRAYPRSGVSSLSWVITAYATLFAALLAASGRLADVLGRRTLFRLGVGGFALMSAACAAAPSVPVLLVARALQGATAAAMIPASLAIVLADTPAPKRRASIGVWSAAGAFAAAVGPSVGGVFVHAFGWRSLFLINVPTGLALALAAGAVPRTERRHVRLPDPFGTLLLAAGVGLAALGLSRGTQWGWGDARTIASLVGGVIGVVGAVQRSWRNPAPAIETRLWKERTFAVANATSLLYGMSLYAWMLLGVFVLTQLWHYSELQAGLAMTPGALAASVTAVAGGRARSHTAPRTITIAGSLMMAASGITIALTLPRHAEFLTYWLPLGILLGSGMGLVTTGTSTAAAVSLPPTSFAAGTGLNQTARQVGGALGIAALAALIASGTPGAVGTFKPAYVFVSLVILVCAVVAIGLRFAPAPAVETSEQPPELVPDLSGLPWRRFVAVGDSMAAGTGDPSPGYAHAGWADLLARSLGVRYLNLGRRGLLAREVHATQLQEALAFAPDLATVLCSGNDLMQGDRDIEAIEREVDAIVSALRAAGSDVIMLAPFDITQTELVPAEHRAPWHMIIEQMSEIAHRVAQRHDAIMIDFRGHPAGADPGIYSRDLIHLNARGHAICAAEVARALSDRAVAGELQAA